ncbi:MAG TPA: PQQ-dependent sugar dehydrogenase [Myxococcota bacterium]|nr:PQQ-dependent sugar dehydrogenase [Myxococcota bacterium]
MRLQLQRRLSAAGAAAWITSIGLALAACGGGGGSAGGGGGGDFDITLEPAFGGMDFDAPVKLVQHPVDDDRWYVVEQGGLIWTFEAPDPSALPIAPPVLALDLLTLPLGINLGPGSEQGLLGLAFDPDFDNGGELYITYTDEDEQDSILARFTSPDPDGPFVPAVDEIVLAIPHSANNHNGGDIMFGADEYLYYSMGDGANSPLAQMTSSLLGKVLRIDVLGPPAAGEAYNVPATNPFQTVPSRPFCDVGEPQRVRIGVEVHAPGIAQAEGEDLGAGLPGGAAVAERPRRDGLEGIRRRDRVRLAGRRRALHVDAQHLAEQ